MKTTTYRSGNDKIGYCTVIIHDPVGDPVTEHTAEEIKRNRSALEYQLSSCCSQQYGFPVKATVLWDQFDPT